MQVYDEDEGKHLSHFIRFQSRKMSFAHPNMNEITPDGLCQHVEPIGTAEHTTGALDTTCLLSSTDSENMAISTSEFIFKPVETIITGAFLILCSVSTTLFL